LARASRGTDPFYYTDMAGMLAGHPRRRICMQGYHACVLEADGGLHACVNSEALKFGNLREHPFRELWWGEGADTLRRALHEQICPSCPSKCYARPVGTREVAHLALEKLQRHRSNAAPADTWLA
jgi:radical SAM protein with 4Fe4S-binding SPASM domain